MKRWFFPGLLLTALMLAVLPALWAAAQTTYQTWAAFIAGSPSLSLPIASGDVVGVVRSGATRKLAVSAIGASTGMKSGVTCNGTTDSQPAMQAELDGFSTLGGGFYYVPPGQRCLISAADLVIPFNVQVTCTQSGGGGQPDAAFATYADFLIVSTRSIKSSTPSASSTGGRSGIYGCLLVRSTYQTLTTLRQFITGAASFAGDAVVCDGQTDFAVENNTIIGFANGISSNCSRLTVRKNRIDATNGFVGGACGDTCYIEQNEVWPFAAGSTVTGPQTQTSTVTNVTNAGGLFEVTISTAPPTTLVSGDIVTVYGVGGTTTANGRWTISVIDTTHFTLNGSTFAGSYTSGGSVFLTSLRTGVAFSYGSSYFGAMNTEFGWDTGFLFTSGSLDTFCNQCWADYWINHDPTPIGVKTSGTAAHSHWSGFINYPQTAVQMGGSAADDILYLSDYHIAGLGSVLEKSALTINHGKIIGSGGYVESVSASTNWLYVGDGTKVYLNSIPTNQGNVVFQTAGNCANLFYYGVPSC